MMLGQIVGAALGGLFGGKDSSGGTQTTKSEPWGAAVPWLEGNIQTGQDLQRRYQANPFNAIQQTAFGNLLGGTDYINRLVPGLLSQMNNYQPFDRANPTRRPQPLQFAPMRAGSMKPLAGLLGASSQPVGLMPQQPAYDPRAGMLAEYGSSGSPVGLDAWKILKANGYQGPILDNAGPGTGA